MMPDCPDALPLPEPPTTNVGMWFWGLLFVSVFIFEIWATWKHKPTLTDTVRKGPRWFKISIGLGFLVVLWHLFAQ